MIRGTLFEDFVDLIDDLFDNFLGWIIHFISSIFTDSLTIFKDFLFSILGHNYDFFVDSGRSFVNNVLFDVPIHDDNFFNNFIYFFIGALVFSLLVRFSIKFIFKVLDYIADLVT